ncbi:Ada metal-binding domain-containing protein [Streptomyces sp. NPDC006632]|uniref:bifunctional transcriptional activator/DNA repair enzyme AdaA n=1 Tax=Streptomyces sp. NPDC006632 TaxID=3157182 RepID=UPI0033AE7BD7
MPGRAAAASAPAVPAGRPPPIRAARGRELRPPSRSVEDDARWRAVLDRDSRADSSFCYGVLTTGTYSRPSCGSRPPHRGHLVFFPDGAAAERAGFRPCRRCRPDGSAHAARTAAVIRSCRAMEAPGTPPPLAELAAGAGFSRFHFHRVFVTATGVTPKAYADACRAERLRLALPRTRTITDAIYQAGFNTNGNFYARAQSLLGMTPTVFKNRGRGVRIHYATTDSPLGRLLVGASGRGVCSLLIGRDTDTVVRRLREAFTEAQLSRASPELSERLAATLGRAAPLAVPHAVPRDIRATALAEWLRTALNEAWDQTHSAEG